jgi:hypothetical protein
LYKYLPYLTQFDTLQITTTDAVGDYHFASVNHSTYLIKVFPDTSYNTLVPTYYGNVFLWDAAPSVTHDCQMSDTFNIVTVEELVATGPGFLQGSVLEDIGFSRQPGDPIPGVDVKLGRNPGGQLVTSTQTDSTGTYTFTGVAYDNYIIYADIPGLGRDSSYVVTVDATNDSIFNLDYVVDSSVVFIVNNTATGVHPNIAQTKEKVFSVYPNPSDGNASIEYSISKDANVSLGIYNVLGVKIIDIANDEQMSGTHKYSINKAKDNELASGIYFVTLIVDGKISIQRLVINK